MDDNNKCYYVETWDADETLDDWLDDYEEGATFDNEVEEYDDELEAALKEYDEEEILKRLGGEKAEIDQFFHPFEIKLEKRYPDYKETIS